MCIKAVREEPHSLKFVPDYLIKTQDMRNEAVKKCLCFPVNVSDKYDTLEMHERVVEGIDTNS